MARRFWKKVDFLTWGGLLMLIVATGLYVVDAGYDEAAIKAEVEADLQADFLERVNKTMKESRLVAKRYKESRVLGVGTDIIRLAMNSDCELVQWSNSELLPSTRLLNDLCNFPDQRTFQDNNKVYYYFRHHIPGFTIVTLIPIQVRYTIENSFLPPYVFLGRYQHQPSVAENIKYFGLYLRQVEGAIKIFDEQENFVYALTVPDWEVFTYETKLWVIFLFAGGLLLLLIRLYRASVGLKWEVGGRKISAIWMFVLLLVVVRWLMFALGLPNSYRPMELFSSTILAVDTLSPSLGDLGLNVLLGLTVIWTVLRHNRRQISRFYKWAMQKETVAWTVQCLILTICGLSTQWFFNLMENVIRHSTIHFEFENVFQLDLYSYMAFGVLGLVLVGLELLLLELLRFSFHFFKGHGTWGKVALSLAWLCALSFMLFGLNAAYLVSVPVIFSMSLLIFIRTKRTLVFKLDLLNFLLVISIFSLLTTIGVVKGNEIRKMAEMETLAEKQSDEHDLVTEALFERVVNEVEAESFLLDYTRIDGLAQRLKERFFESNFKGYEVRIFLYDNNLKLMDKTGDYRPYLHPNS
ncbi:MAG: hypothetical protein AAF570_18905, partial [Bacteroidota bacterium]